MRDRDGETASMGYGTGQVLLNRTPSLCYVFDASQPEALEPARYNLIDVDQVVFRRGQANIERLLDERKLVLHIPDQAMSGMHATLTRQNDLWLLKDEGSKNGTMVNGKTCTERVLAAGDLLEFGSTFFLFYPQLESSVFERADRTEKIATAALGLHTLHPELGRVYTEVCRIARGTTSVIIQGPTGSGKERVAQAIHDLSGRNGRFVAVNCAAIAESLLESELFGHKKGAFSGATADKEGLFQASDGGTLFLDEVADLSPRAQVALLRALQQSEVMPVGATSPVKIDLRVVAATNRDLADLIEEEKFREDLWARLNGLTVELPALADRKMDLGLIVRLLIAGWGKELKQPRFTVAAVRFLFEYNWPRNVRELDKALRTSTALADIDRIDRYHIERSLGHGSKDTAEEHEPIDVKSQLLFLLETHGGNLTRVADAMGKRRQQIQRWCKQFGIDASAFRRP